MRGAGGTLKAWQRQALLALLLVLATWLLAQVLRERPTSFELRVEMRVDRPSLAQLFYDGGRGFNENDSDLRSLRGSGKFEPVIFRIAAPSLHALRLDPCNGECGMEVRNLELVSKAGRWPIPLEQLRALHEIDSLQPAGNAVAIRTASHALDPQLQINLESPITARGRLHPARAALFLAALVAVLIAVCFLALRGGAPTGFRQPRAWVFPVACSVIAVGMSLVGLNGSSSAALLRPVDGSAASPGLLLGEAKSIRSDEWMVHTPWLLSQMRQTHPLSSQNPSVGGERAPLVCNLPVAHWSMLFRPQLWAFFAAMPADQAFAFFWNFKWWSLLCGSYALLLIVTRGHPLLSAAGALILLWTSTVQWWFSSPTLMPDMVGLLCGALASALGAIVSRRRRLRLLFAAACVFCALGFLFCCYPPFQIPLLTLSVPLLLALLRDHDAVRHWRPIGVAMALIVVLAAVFAWQVRDTLFTISALAYPGQRFSVGGGATWSSIVRGFLTLDISELHFPASFSNVVAASSYLNALPLLACLHLARWRRERTADSVQSVLLLFAAFTILFAICGIPSFLAKISLWSYVPADRTTLALALASTLALCRYLSCGDEAARGRVRARDAVIGAVTFAIVLAAANRDLGSFIAPAAVVAVWLYFMSAGLLVTARLRFASLAAIIFPLAFFNLFVNPLSRGIPAYTATPVSAVMTRMRDEFPQTRWIVFGSWPRAAIVSALFKATGATVLSGVTAVPNREMLDSLDPTGENAAVYSRYAAVTFQPLPQGAAAPRFHLDETTIYTIQLPLTEDWLRSAGVDGVLVLDAPALPVPEHYRELEVIAGYRFWSRSPDQ